MLRIIGRIFTILLVAAIIGGITYVAVQALGGQAVGFTPSIGRGGPRGGSLVMGLGTILLNVAEVAVVIGIVYPLQRWWLNRQPAPSARPRRPLAATPSR